MDIMVSGKKSGNHSVDLVLTKDKKTIIFKPNRNFFSNDTVNVELSFDLKGVHNSIQYTFNTSNTVTNDDLVLSNNFHDLQEKINRTQAKISGDVSLINGVSVPSDFPTIHVDIFNETSKGRLFLGSYYSTIYIMILENDGTPYFYQRLASPSIDFKVQPSGTLTRNVSLGIGYVEMDSNYNIIDTLSCGHGYLTDIHELQILSNGNYLVIARDDQEIDMSLIVEGGDSDATVRGNHVQELDRNGNVVFEWRSWDHFDITDAIDVDLTANTIDYVHMNALAVDYDNHILISSRHLSEITKINRQTGEIIWRLGGKNNQFQFVNDQYGISYQHDIRPVPNSENHYTLFDNGNHHSPQFSRAVEFKLDTLTMMATKIWEYRHTPDRFSSKRGNAQRLPNGNTVINWSSGTLPKVTEVTSAGEIIYEMNFDEVGEEGLISYRSFRFDWDGVAAAPYLIVEPHSEHVTLIYNKFGDESVAGYRIYGGKDPNPNQLIGTTSEPFAQLSDLDNYQSYYFRVTAVDSNDIESDFSNEETIFVKFLEPGENLLLNGDFSEGSQYWELLVNDEAIAQGFVEEEYYHLQIDSIGSIDTDIKLGQSNLEIIENRQYVLEFDAWSSEPKIFNIRVHKSSDPFKDYSKIGAVYSTPDRNHYKYEFYMDEVSDYSAEIAFECGQSTADIYIDNVSLKYISESSVGRTNQLPMNYKLYSNYPNPFNPATMINYQLPIISDVDLSIYNILGQKVITLVSEKQNSGHHQVQWDASGFASGIYYYRIKAGEFHDVKKMILLR